MEFELGYATEERVGELSARRGEPAWLHKDRARALDAFLVMPVEPLALFTRHTDLRGVEVGKVTPVEDGQAEAVVPVYDGEDRAAFARVSEGRLREVRITEKLRGRDFYLNEALGLLEERPKVAKSLLARPDSLPKDDKFGMMSRALFSTALVLSVPPRVDITRPIHLQWSFADPASALHTRTLIHLGAGSRVSVIEEFVSDGAGGDMEEQSLFGNATEVYLEEGARLDYVAIERFANHVVSFFTRQATVGPDGSFHQALGSFGGFLTKSRADSILAGQGSRIRQVEVVYGTGQERYDNTNFVTHRGRDSVSDLLSKAVMQERSRSTLKGVITIEEEAGNADSYLGQYSMLLSRKSKSTAIPSLEIKTNDVQRAQHAASVAQLDEDQVFYLMSRGIPRDSARRMLVEGFLTPIVETVPLPDARAQLYDLIGTKWVA
ncbi:MAG: SufD family Fe-S cluster assembly protein [Thermoplasmata archaeon]